MGVCVCVCVFSVFLFVVLSSVKRSNATSQDIGVGNEGSRGSLASFTSRLVSSKWGLPPSLTFALVVALPTKTISFSDRPADTYITYSNSV